LVHSLVSTHITEISKKRICNFWGSFLQEFFIQTIVSRSLRVFKTFEQHQPLFLANNPFVCVTGVSHILYMICDPIPVCGSIGVCLPPCHVASALHGEKNAKVGDVLV
jgi:hypothetical protein